MMKKKSDYVNWETIPLEQYLKQPDGDETTALKYDLQKRIASREDVSRAKAKQLIKKAVFDGFLEFDGDFVYLSDSFNWVLEHGSEPS
ncbi:MULTISPECIES: hypothetical protein [Halorussus]|uniref:hypothetical protein n=1 Tax=Halorussus TaxID=1070314 RepID=UPI0020A0D728|nr:hypothetical protein [Halorussus vallis]USZ74687.1 hypothetical protein NGM07_14735 [Halorussus vallis]